MKAGANCSTDQQALGDPKFAPPPLAPELSEPATVTARGPLKVVAVAAKSVRRAIAVVREHGSEVVAAIVQGRLVGSQIAEAGLAVQPKVPKPVEKAAA